MTLELLQHRIQIHVFESSIYNLNLWFYRSVLIFEGNFQPCFILSLIRRILQTDYHGGWDSTYLQHLQIWWRQVHMCGQKPFWNIQQQWDTHCERYWFLFHRFWLQDLKDHSFRHWKNTSSSMKLIMKYIVLLYSHQLDRYISHPCLCQLWVIVHVAEWAVPLASMSEREKYSVTSISFKKSCCSIFTFRL